MINLRQFLRGARFMALLGAALAISACANQVSGPQTSAAATPGSKQDFVVNVGDRVFFSTDSSDLSAQSRATLDKQAQWLNHYPQYTFVIEGNADERGTREYNLALGARRAQVVRDYLISQGVPPDRLAAAGFGEYQPIVPGDTPEARAANRRIELKLTER